MWLNLSAATPPTLTGTVHLDLMTFQAHKRPRNKAHTKLTKSVKVTQAFYQSENSIFGSCKNLNLVQFLISSSMLPLSLHSVRESRNVVSLLMQPKTDCLFFFLILFTKNSLWETTWETCGALRHWLIIKHRSHSVLTQLLLLLTAAVTQSFQRNTQLPFTVMIYCIMMTTVDLSVFLLISVKVVPHFSVSSYLEKNSMFKKLFDNTHQTQLGFSGHESSPHLLTGCGPAFQLAPKCLTELSTILLSAIYIYI